MSDEVNGHEHEPATELSVEEKVRRTGHIILDGVTATALDPSPESDEDDPMQLALGALIEIEAIEVMIDEDEEELELDVSPLMGGVLLVVRRLVSELATRDGVSEEAVVASVRAAIDVEG